MFSDADLRALLVQARAHLADAAALVQLLERLTGNPLAATHGGARPGAGRPTAAGLGPAQIHAAARASGYGSVRGAVVAVLERAGPLASREIVRRAVAAGFTSTGDPRRVIVQTISDMTRAGQLRRVGGQGGKGGGGVYALAQATPAAARKLAAAQARVDQTPPPKASRPPARRKASSATPASSAPPKTSRNRPAPTRRRRYPNGLVAGSLAARLVAQLERRGLTSARDLAAQVVLDGWSTTSPDPVHRVASELSYLVRDRYLAVDRSTSPIRYRLRTPPAPGQRRAAPNAQSPVPDPDLAPGANQTPGTTH